MNFQFPQLLAFLEKEKDQVEFMKIAAEVGLGSSDVELGKLLPALQLYKAYYAAIPRQIKAVREDALSATGLAETKVYVALLALEMAKGSASDPRPKTFRPAHATIICAMPRSAGGTLRLSVVRPNLAFEPGRVQAFIVYDFNRQLFGLIKIDLSKKVHSGGL